MARAALATKSPETALPISGIAVRAETAILPINFADQTWWEKLNPDEQHTVQNDSVALARAMVVNGASRMEMGLRLSHLQGVLEPHNAYGRFLKKYFSLSKRTAYRYVNEYENAVANLPEPVIRVAMQRGLNLTTDNKQKPFGSYTEAVRALPPSKELNEEQAAAWLDAVVNKKKEIRTASRDAEGTDDFVMPEPSDPAVAMKACVLFVEREFKKLPQNARTRANWLRTLEGYIAAIGGVKEPFSVTPTAIPEAFRSQRGRRPAAAAGTQNAAAVQ